MPHPYVYHIKHVVCWAINTIQNSVCGTSVGCRNVPVSIIKMMYICDDAEVKQTTPSSITHYTVHVRVFIYTVCAPSHTEHRNRIGTEQCLSLWVKMVVAEMKVPYPCQRSHRGNLTTNTRSGLHWSLCRCKHFSIIRTAGSRYTTVSTATCAVSIGMVSSSPNHWVDWCPAVHVNVPDQ